MQEMKYGTGPRVLENEGYSNAVAGTPLQPRFQRGFIPVKNINQLCFLRVALVLVQCLLFGLP